MMRKIKALDAQLDELTMALRAMKQYHRDLKRLARLNRSAKVELDEEQLQAYEAGLQRCNEKVELAYGVVRSVLADNED